MSRLAGFIIIMAISINANARNPGEDARDCVDARTGNGKVTITNICSEKIFVLACGDIKYTNKNCGDGPSGGFYTQSANIEAGNTYEFALKDRGHFNWAACKGSISFGNDGEYRDYPNGSYNCLVR